jgi:TonB-dependent receptor
VKLEPKTNLDHSAMMRRMLRGGSAAVLVAAMMSTTAFAQDSGIEEEDDVDEIVATGIRQSLQNAQDIKRNADTFVDSITASDIGALPDRSVLEAIQRVPGVSISRFAAGDDPDHFSVEGSGVVIRGLSYVRSEFNGRDAFTANNGRALGFQDVPPELVGGVDVFKNQTADMIEGGISGVVNLKTLKPFDRSEDTFAATVDGTYTDLAEEFSPSVSGLFTKRWDTNAGEFGLLASGSYSNLKSRSDGVQFGGLYPYNPTFTGPGDPSATNNLLAPSGVNIRTQDFDRDRIGTTIAGQWESNDGKTLATAEFIRSETTNAWTEHAIQSEEDPGERAGFFNRGDFTASPLGSPTTVCQNRDACGVQVAGDSLFQSGIITSDAAGWYGRPGIRMTQFSRVSDTKSVTNDLSFNLKYSPTDRLKFNFDAQYVKATTENSDISGFAAQTVDQVVNLNGAAINQSGYPDPTLEYVLRPGSQFNSLTDPASTYWRAAMDHFEDSEGDELALRGDVQYDFDTDGFFKSIRAGYRFAERDQLTKWSNYNWGNLSEAWAGGEVDFSEVSGNTESFTFDNFRRGDVLQGNNEFLFISTDLLRDYRSFVDFTQGNSNFPGAQNHLRGFGGRDASGNLIFVEGDDRFTPAEITDAIETTHAIYARVDFGDDSVASLGGISIDGNYGVRIVETKLETTGAAQFQPNGVCSQANNRFTPEAAEACAVLQQPSTEVTAEVDRTDILPSFNVKFGLTDNLILRLAAARGLSRPSVGQLRAFRNTAGEFNVQSPPPGTDPATFSPLVSFNRYTVSGGNPGLEPTLSNNLDASLEYYFNDVGSFTASAFYKDIENIIIVADAPGSSIGGPVIAGASYNGPQNGGDGKVKGFELAYQQFYDFLPGIFSGLGLQANYTYVDQSSIPNSAADINRASGQQDFADAFVPDDLENLSEHTFNIVGLYESDKVEARIAYNWRSDFLLTTLDVISRLPIYNESTGQVDASFKYQFTDNFQLGVQGVNLLSEVTETTSQINPEGDRFLRSRFENDRRVSIVGSFTF